MFYTHAQKQTQPSCVAISFLLFFFLLPTGSLRYFLGWPRFWFETYELFCYFVVGPLREYSHDGQTGIVHRYTPGERIAGIQAALFGQFSELQDRQADDTVFSGEAVVLHRDVKLVGLWAMFVTQHAGRRRYKNIYINTHPSIIHTFRVLTDCDMLSITIHLIPRFVKTNKCTYNQGRIYHILWHRKNEMYCCAPTHKRWSVTAI